MSFEYPALPNDHDIRLLHIFPGNLSDDLKCEMFVASLLHNQVSEYTALSYVWGVASDIVQITCNGYSLPITKNLEAALKRLRYAEQPVWVWADALCINQADVMERNKQVMLMKTIYRTASLVAAYIGEETGDTGLAFELMGKLFMASELVPEREKLTMVLQEAYSGRNAGVLDIPPQHDHAWVALQNLFRREYFTRVWVVQEIATACKDPRVICGSHRTWWKEIMDVARLLSLTWIRSTRTIDNSFQAHVMGLFRKEVRQGQDLENLRLKWLLAATRRFCSTDPRDKVFALYGLASDIYDADGVPLLKADYSLTTEQVFSDVAAFLIQTDGRLDVLEYAGDLGEKKFPNLPSWIPDWTHRDQVVPLYAGISHSRYAADAQMGQSYIMLTPDRTRIIVCAILVDFVRLVCESFDPEDFAVLPHVRKRPGMLVRLWENVKVTLGDDYCTGESTVDAFWRTLIANVDRDRAAVDESWYIRFLQYWREARLCDLEAERYARDIDRSKGEKLSSIIPEHEAHMIQHKMEFTVQEQHDALKRMYRRRLHTEMARLGGTEDDQQCTGASSGCETCSVMSDESFVRMAKLLPPLREDDPFLEMIDDDTFIADWYRRLRDDIYDPLPIIHGEDEKGGYASSLSRFTGNRTFFLTSAGLMALDPMNVQLDDVVAIVAGSKVPLVLRPVSSEPSEDGMYTLVGEAYVHGIMDGSAAQCIVDEEGNPLRAMIVLK